MLQSIAAENNLSGFETDVPGSLNPNAEKVACIVVKLGFQFLVLRQV